MTNCSQKKSFLSGGKSKFMKRVSKKRLMRTTRNKFSKRKASRKRRRRSSRGKRMRGGSGLTGSVFDESSYFSSKMLGNNNFSDNLPMKHDAAGGYGKGNEYLV